MYKIAVTGAYDSIFGFAALGLDTFPVSGAEEGKNVLKKLVSEGYGVIYMTEALAAELIYEIDEYRSQVIPMIILIPGTSGNTGAGVAGVKKSVEQAVGSDIVFSNR